MQATKLPLFSLDNDESGGYTPSYKLIDKSIKLEAWHGKGRKEQGQGRKE
jgi:hypothetical protein